MPTSRNPAWAEILQLLPIVTLALPFIVSGTVDLGRAGSGFMIAALLTIPVSAAVVVRKHLLNPILVGTGVWLWLGAIAFNAPIEAVAAWLTQTQAFGLFLAALGVGLAAAALSPAGYIACPCPDRRWIRRASLGLVALTALVVIWAWLFRHDIRLGGGLPFIVLNVARRVLASKAPASVVPCSG